MEQVLVEFCVNLSAVIAGHQHLGCRQLEWPAVVKQKRLRKKLEGIRLFHVSWRFDDVEESYSDIKI